MVPHPIKIWNNWSGTFLLWLTPCCGPRDPAQSQEDSHHFCFVPPVPSVKKQTKTHCQEAENDCEIGIIFPKVNLVLVRLE